MDSALRLLIGLCLLAAPLRAQILAPILYGTPASTAGTNIQYVGNAYTFSGSGTSISQAYTCNSTSNRLVVIGQASGSNTLTLTDTGGEAAGATVLVSSGSFPPSDTWAAWNSACASGSNTYTLHLSSSAANVLTFVEYSGLSSSAGTSATGTGTGTATVSATASQAGMLALIYKSGSSSPLYTASTNTFNWRTRVQGNQTTTNNQDVFDNISASSGTVSFSVTQGSATVNLGMILIPGVSAPSPNWNPSWYQTNICNQTATCAFNQNVTSGDLITVGFANENTNTPTGISDSLGTSFTLRKSLATPSGVEMFIYTGIPTSSGADTVTVTGSFTYESLHITEFVGSGQNVTDTGGQNTSSGTMAWTQAVSHAGSLVLVECGGFHSSSTFSISQPGWTFLQYNNGGDGRWGGWISETGTSSLSLSVSVSTTDGNVCASIVTH